VILIRLHNKLNDVFFLKESFGWIVGDDGAVLHSYDGGVSWNERYSGTRNNLRGIDFLNENTGYLTGFKGTILKYKEHVTIDKEIPVLFSQNIKIEVPEDDSAVRISLFNKRGEKLLELINGTKNQGDYLFNMRSSIAHIPDGIYYLQIKIDQKSKILKVVIIR
jgi:hypothetical protein